MTLSPFKNMSRCSQTRSPRSDRRRLLLHAALQQAPDGEACSYCAGAIATSASKCALVALERHAARHRSPAARADERRSGRHLDSVRADDDLGGAVVHVEDGPPAIASHQQMIDGGEERMAGVFSPLARKRVREGDTE